MSPTYFSDQVSRLSGFRLSVDLINSPQERFVLGFQGLVQGDEVMPGSFKPDSFVAFPAKGTFSLQSFSLTPDSPVTSDAAKRNWIPTHSSAHHARPGFK